MTPADTIRRKRDGGELSPAELRDFADGAARGTWPDYQLAALLMAITIRGMSDAETAALTAAMADSGERVDLADIPGVKVDKHSTGGVGDKTSLILAPLVAACGVVVPMMSGRGLGHTGGTLDKLEAIPGFRVNLSLAEFRAALAEIGVAMIGQTETVAPADRVLYALRDVTATVESVPLITASILSKKLAEGISGLVLDVKCGRGAFMRTRADARTLADSLVRVGRANGLNVDAVLTPMDEPLGQAVGNALEVLEAVRILQGECVGPAATRLRDLSLLLAARMLRLADPTLSLADAQTRARTALDDGSALAKFRDMVARQGGDPRVADEPESVLPPAPLRMPFRARQSGFLTGFDAGLVGRAAMALGAGRVRAADRVDPAVGVWVLKSVGERVEAGEPIAVIHALNAHPAATALDMLEAATAIGPTPPAATPLIWEAL